jgi:hypothetical protein
VAPLSTLAVPVGFLPRAALTAAPRVAPASTAVPRAAPTSFATLTAVLDGPPPCEWLASPITYVRRSRQPTPAGTTSPPPLWSPLVGGQGAVVPVMPLENPH